MNGEHTNPREALSEDQRDCRTCKYNSYLGKDMGPWVSCSHPVTLQKMPKWERGDPAFVSMRTGDLRVADIADVADCPTWEAI